ncbi:MAG: ACT domain-containing protein [Lachnospiraceae bacterium]|nr:ACT domain-containing protein [Lachnospiraceae bacterium]
MKKIVIVIYGKDNYGILYNVSKILHDYKVSVENIRQSIVSNYFNMMAIVSAPERNKYGEFKKKLEDYGKKSNLMVNVMLEDVFNAMHQV